MLKASTKQLNFGTLLRSVSMDRFRDESQAELKADQAHFDRKYSGTVGCPFLAAQNKVRSWFGREPVTRESTSSFEQTTNEKDDRYEKYKRLLNTNDQKIYSELAKLRYPESKLGITETDREDFKALFDQKIELTNILDFVGSIVTRNVEALFNGLVEEAKSDKDFEKKNNLSLKEVQSLVAELVGGFRNSVSNQLEYFRIGAQKLLKVSEAIQFDLKQLSENNIRILQSSSFLQLGQFRRLLNYFNVKKLGFENEEGKYRTQPLKIDNLFELRAMSEKSQSPILVPKEEFVEELESDLKKTDTYMDGKGAQSLCEIKSHGDVRGCLAGELDFPDHVRAEFQDTDSYRLKKNVLLELAHYVHEVIAELVIPTIRIVKPSAANS